MKYAPEGMLMWDAWGLSVRNPQTGQEQVHVFHLQMPMPESDETIEQRSLMMGHACSDDLLHWKTLPAVLPPRGLPMDTHRKNTGCLVEKDGRFYLFYGMVHNWLQHIGLSLSDDLIVFSEYEHNPVLTPEAGCFITYGHECGWENRVDARDMIIVPHPDYGYIGYFAASAPHESGTNVGVIGVAVSCDLITWKQKGVAYYPPGVGVSEVPDVYEIDGMWYMTMLIGFKYGRRGAFTDPYVSYGTIYAVSDSPFGPFRERPDDNVLIAGSVMSTGYSVRSLLYQGQRYVLYVDKNGGQDTLSLPKQVGVTTSGRLRLYHTDLLHKLRIRDLQSELHIVSLPPCSFAWPTIGGDFTEIDQGIKAVSVLGSMQAGLFRTAARNLEISAEISYKAEGFGFALFSRSEEAYKPNVVLIEPALNRMSLTAYPDFELRETRQFDFAPKNGRVKLTVMVVGQTCDVYIDRELVLQGNICVPGPITPGLFIDRGCADFEQMEAYELESTQR